MIANDDAAAAVKGALENLLLGRTCKDVDDTGGTISHALIRALLEEPPADDVINETSPSHQHQSSCNGTLPSTTALCHQLRGLPKMPLYKEISHRLQIIQQYSKGHNDDAALPCFLPASHFGLTEMCTLNELIPPPPQSSMDFDGCIRWFLQAGNDGICALLGCRRTIGTIQLHHPLLRTPCFHQLSHNCCMHHDKDTNPIRNHL
jgi:hypothetical protein